MRRYLDLETIIRPIVDGLGYTFIGLECFPSNSGTVLRVYIDIKHGVGIDDCKKVSYQINQVLSVEGGLKNNYTLEVSSPGLDRKLYSVDQCIAQIGKVIKLSLAYPIAARRNFKGILRDVRGEQLMLEIDGGQEMLFNFVDVTRAQVVTKW
jgi:ribosome maturation factor RimP